MGLVVYAGYSDLTVGSDWAAKRHPPLLQPPTFPFLWPPCLIIVQVALQDPPLDYS